MLNEQTSGNWLERLPAAPLRWAAVIMMIVFAFAALRYVSAYNESIQPGNFRSFSVTGEGKAVVVPDVARFTFGVVTETNNQNITAIQTENTTKMNKIIGVLKAAGIDEKDIKTENYNLTPRYNYCYRDTIACPPSQIVGYSLDQTVSVKVRDFSKIGNLLSQVVTAGATNISQVEFTVDDLETVKNSARAEAIARAREQAKSTAKAGGFRVGKLLSLEEGGNFPYPIYGKGGGVAMDMVEQAVNVAPSIEPGSSEINVTVILRYEIN